MPAILAQGGPEVQWTEMAKTQYHRLFKSTARAPTPEPSKDTGGPAAAPLDKEEETRQPEDDECDALKVHDVHMNTPLSFKFAPDITHLINPAPDAIVSATSKPSEEECLSDHAAAHRLTGPTRTLSM
jgi:hypothetical protein